MRLASEQLSLSPQRSARISKIISDWRWNLTATGWRLNPANTAEVLKSREPTRVLFGNLKPAGMKPNSSSALFFWAD